MNEDSFFIPARRNKQKATIELKPGVQKRVKRHYENGVLIFDEEDEKKEKQQANDNAGESVKRQFDVNIEYSENEVAFEAKRVDNMKTAFLAARLYLEPANVMHLTKYWIMQYVNYKLDESEWFNDHIRNLMIHPVHFQLTSSQGIAYVLSNYSKYSTLLHICGSALHKIPSEYFVQKNCCEEIFEYLCHFLEPSNQAFLVKNTLSLNGELELAGFQYNGILSYFYEPSFLIITSYSFYVNYLLSIKRYRQVKYFLPQIKHIMKPIEHKTVPWERLFSLNEENTNYEEKRRVFEEDITALYAALDHTELDPIKNALTALWSKKAAYVAEQMYVRLEAIEAQLYPDRK